MINAERLRRDIIVIGASAGGVTALRTLFNQLPAELPAVVAVVLHRSPHFESQLPAVLGRGTPHRIREPSDTTPLNGATIYVAPRDRHMVFEDGTLNVHRGPKQHYTRPAVDPLFASAAATYGRRVVGVLLSGGGDDGTDGLTAIKAQGGISIAQDPNEAEHWSMPLNAVRYDHIDLVLPLRDIARHLTALIHGEPLPDPHRRC